MIYLDHNATSPLRPSIASAMAEIAAEPLNASSIHASGRRAKKLLEDARAEVARAISVFPNEVIFTSSATEANLTVLRSFAAENWPILTSPVEHASVGKAGRLLGAAKLDVDAQGIVKLDDLEAKLAALKTSPLRGEVGAQRATGEGVTSNNSPPPNLPPLGGGNRPFLVSVMLANNETGAVQPIADIARIVHAHGGFLHADAVQALGKIPIDCGLLGVDMLTLCAHKAGGPVGVGALIVRDKTPLKPLFLGGGQELGRRAGTENIPLIVGLAALVREVAGCAEAAEMQRLRDWLQAELCAAAPDARVFGIPNPVTRYPSPESSDHRITGSSDHRINGSSDHRINGSSDHRINGSSDQRIIGSPDHRITESTDQRISGSSDHRLPNTLQLTMPGVGSETQLMHFDLGGFAVSAGSACSSGRVEASHVLLAMGVEKQVAQTAIRISLGWNTTQADVEKFAESWKALYHRLRNTAAA